MKFIKTLILIGLIAFTGFLYHKQMQLESKVAMYMSENNNSSNTQETEIQETSLQNDEISDTQQDQPHEQNFVNQDRDIELISPEEEEAQLQKFFEENTKNMWAKVTSVENTNILANGYIASFDEVYNSGQFPYEAETKPFTIQVASNTQFEGKQLNSIAPGDFIKIYTDDSLFDDNTITATRVQDFEHGIIPVVRSIENDEAIY